MSIDLSTLNANQSSAVKWQEGPLLVLAGPGSGKTQVLTFRIARLIEETPEERYKILGLTFTNKAASEMRERIAQLVPDASARILLTTFHSFCADLIRQHGYHIGLKPDFTILGQKEDREAVLEEAIRSASPSEDYQAESLLPFISHLIDNNILVDQAERLLANNGTPNASELARIYSSYRELLIANNRLDFGALIAEAIHLLSEYPGIKKQIHRIYSFICVDEFQDTNLCQYQVLRNLVNPKSNNLFVVADDDQIIYQWNGASPERLNKLREEFDMKVVQLPENYRCPPKVIEMANRLIAYNIGRSPDKQVLQAHKTGSEDKTVRLMKFDDLEQEAKWVADEIAARPKPDQENCAIIARTRKVLEVFVKALNGAGVHGYLTIRKDEFVSPQLQWLHGMLRLTNSRQNREQLRKVCKAFYSLEGINLKVADIVSEAAAEDGDYLRTFCRLALHRDELAESTRSMLEKPVNSLAEQLDFRGFIRNSWEWFQGLNQTSADTGEQADEFAEEKKFLDNLISDVDVRFEAPNVTLHLLLQELDLQSKTPPAPPGAIPCFTIHASKGMEFGHVYLVAVVEDQLPSWAAKKKTDNSKEMQEERRNCFVAITRTQESLTMTYSKNVFGWSKEPSRFLREMELLNT